MLISNGGEIVFQNCTIIIQGNLTVSYNASLTLINTTVKFNSTHNGSSEFKINTGGTLTIKDYDDNPYSTWDRSIITGNICDGRHRFKFIIAKMSNFTILNSELHQCGYSEAPKYYGLYIKADNSTIENNIFSNNYGGMIIEASNVSIKNNLFINNSEYGLMIILGRNKTIINNSMYNNGYNFGLLVTDRNQNNTITNDNILSNGRIIYIEKQENMSMNSTTIQAGFLGIVNSTNILVSDQLIEANFNGGLIFGSNKSILSNIIVENNYYGLLCEDAVDFSIFNSNFSDNKFIGIELVDNCWDFVINNCIITNNFIGLSVTNSNLTLKNSPLQKSQGAGHRI